MPSRSARADSSPYSGGTDASTARFSLTYFDPPEVLRQHVLTLFHFVTNEPVTEDRHPGLLPQLFLTLSGKGEVRFSDHVDSTEFDATLFSGFDTAVPIRVEGPWHAIGASLTPLGWAALTGKAASAHVNRLVPARELLGQAISIFAKDLIARWTSGEIDGEQGCEELGAWIAANLQPVPIAHMAVIGRTIGWLGTSLNPDVDALFDGLDYSRRQAERLVMRYFGFTPAALARRFRAVRAANLLAQRDLTDEAEAEIAAAFYDQPHMIREIRRYCGFTPTRLGGEAEPLFQTMLRLHNLDRISQFRRIGERAAQDSP